MIVYKKKINLDELKKIKLLERYKVHPFNKRFIYWIVHFMDPIEETPTTILDTRKTNALSTHSDLSKN